MNLKETHALRKLDAAFAADHWTKLPRQVDLVTDRGTVRVYVRRHGINSFLASCFGMSIAGETPTVAVLKLAERIKKEKAVV